MFACNCGKEYKTEKGLSSHQEKCDYADINIDRIYKLGGMIDDVDKKLFHVSLGSIKKYAKLNTVEFDDAKKILQQEIIYKYRKSLWDILMVWQDSLLVSEYRSFLKWIFKTYKDINLLSLRNTLCNGKIIYRYNMETSREMIEKRIDNSLIYIHEHGEFHNDFVFVDAILSGNISMYFVLFNDWLAQKWFSRLDMDLQKELEEYVEIASKNIINRIKPDDFDILQKLANTIKPVIHRMDY